VVLERSEAVGAGAADLGAEAALALRGANTAVTRPPAAAEGIPACFCPSTV
jgi:hypothetical protein